MIWPVQSSREKHSASVVGQISDLTPRVSPDERGVAQRHERAGRMRWTRRHAKDERGCSRTAKSCGPGAPTLALSPQGMETSLRATVARKPGHRGEHEASRKTTAQGKPELLRLTCGPTPVLFVARDPRVQPAPGFPCALSIERGSTKTRTSGILCRGNADSHRIRCLTIESKHVAAGSPGRAD